jgi:hypothetical protein
MKKERGRRVLEVARKLGTDRNQTAVKLRKADKNFSQSRDIHEDRGRRQSKLGKVKQPNVKRAVFRFAVLGLLTLAFSMTAEARTYQPHSRINDPVLITQLHQQMALLEDNFMKIEDSTTASSIDYNAILKAVEQMDAARTTIRQIVPDKSWNKPLTDLSSQLKKVDQAAVKQDPAMLRSAVDGIYDTCFRCHAANAPRY